MSDVMTLLAEGVLLDPSPLVGGQHCGAVIGALDGLPCPLRLLLGATPGCAAEGARAPKLAALHDVDGPETHTAEAST